MYNRIVFPAHLNSFEFFDLLFFYNSEGYRTRLGRKPKSNEEEVVKVYVKIEQFQYLLTNDQKKNEGLSCIRKKQNIITCLVVCFFQPLSTGRK